MHSWNRSLQYNMYVIVINTKINEYKNIYQLK